MNREHASPDVLAVPNERWIENRPLQLGQLLLKLFLRVINGVSAVAQHPRLSHQGLAPLAQNNVLPAGVD